MKESGSSRGENPSGKEVFPRGEPTPAGAEVRESASEDPFAAAQSQTFTQVPEASSKSVRDPSATGLDSAETGPSATGLDGGESGPFGQLLPVKTDKPRRIRIIAKLLEDTADEASAQDEVSNAS